jgi:hypothetical protein
MRLALGLEVQIFMPYTSLDGMAILSPYGQPIFVISLMTVPTAYAACHRWTSTQFHLMELDSGMLLVSFVWLR